MPFAKRFAQPNCNLSFKQCLTPPQPSGSVVASDSFLQLRVAPTHFSESRQRIKPQSMPGCHCQHLQEWDGACLP